ncbi:MAG: signal peptidase II [Propionibacteriaceae bacterium]|nr:signal peptidase II [Propionibacteriaceae bacterium]
MAIADEPVATGSARRYRLLAAGIALIGIALDQLTKALAIAHLDPYQPIQLLGGLLTLQLIRNPGAAFSLGEQFTVVFTCIAIGALIGVSGWLLPKVRHIGWAVATGCLLAGIVGNLIDRLFREPGAFHGHVIDFLQLPHFAIFNVADMFITAAAALVIWLSLITQVSVAGVRLKRADG